MSESTARLHQAGPGPALRPADRFVVVNAPSGLRLRAGPSTRTAILRKLSNGTALTVLGRVGPWAAVDIDANGTADGFVSGDFLQPMAEPGPGPADPADIADQVTAGMVRRILPDTPVHNIERNLPFVLSGLRALVLADRDMVNMALSTIRCETEGFEPISEFVSRFNTLRRPFDLYDFDTEKGRGLGNSQPGDGARYCGRGYVQLTGRANYRRIGGQIGVDLETRPDRANEPAIAGQVIAMFLKNQERAIRQALAADDLRTARRLVNGGSHGLTRFSDSIRRGREALP